MTAEAAREAQPPIIDALVEHILGACYEDLAARDIAKAKIFLLDTLGVGIAGSRGAAIDRLIATVGSWGTGEEATVWVTGQRMPAQLAAIINAYQIHCLEYDCVHEAAVLHPMATLLSATMAYAERRSQAGRPVSGEDLLLALAIGVDVATLLGVAATGPMRFFRPATAGGIGVAAALARLDGLDDAGVRDALGAAYCQTSGTLQPHLEGSPMLGLQIGFNARAGLAAVDLAAAGFRGPHDVIDGRYGYLRLMENDAFDLDRIRPLLGREWQIARLSHKPFPSGRLTHGVVDALRQLTARDGFAADDVAQVTARVPPLVHRLVGRPDIPRPEPNYAKLCLPFIAGAWLAKGRIDISEFASREALADRRVHEFAARVEVIDDGNPDENAMDPQTFTVRLEDGSEHSITLTRVYGHPDAPLTTAENEDKFRRCVAHARAPMPTAAADALVAAVADLEAIADVAELAQMTLIAAART